MADIGNSLDDAAIEHLTRPVPRSPSAQMGLLVRQLKDTGPWPEPAALPLLVLRGVQAEFRRRRRTVPVGEAPYRL